MRMEESETEDDDVLPATNKDHARVITQNYGLCGLMERTSTCVSILEGLR